MKQQKLSPEQANQWFQQNQWAEGLQLNPHPSTDKSEFSFQYMQNQECWDKAFAFLKDNDLSNLAAGKYPIMGEQVFASVSDANSKKPEDARWEAHKKYIDIQCVVRGEEIIGVAPLSAAVRTISFDPEKDLGFYEIPENQCHYHTALPGTFFVFFPHDAHRPCIRSTNGESEKKIVIKIIAIPSL